jgi:AraC family transcriptional regulator
LSLDLLADEAGLSKFHFHQLFHRTTGETPKEYVDRLRLEWAALQLSIRRARVIDIALECGYRNHETFTRAFRARFNCSPRDYRTRWSERRSHSERARKSSVCPELAQLAATRVVTLARTIVAFVRHLGPYERVSPRHFSRLTAWARRRSLAGDPPTLFGIAHDPPGLTPDDKLRFDCCIQVRDWFDADGDIACQRLPGGLYGLTEYVGSWDLGPVYSSIIQRLRSNRSIAVVGLPAIEIFRTTRIGPRHGLASVSIAIPVKRA